MILVTEQVGMALDGDQGGSIRIPAAWSGVVGYKPTNVLVPYTGCMMIEMTLDHCGPMANTVEDSALMLSAIAGPDPLDPRQRGVIPAHYVRDYRPAIGKGVAGRTTRRSSVPPAIPRSAYRATWPTICRSA